jgi:3-methylcrotonyl-CoA carboxylase alpha subunit
MEMNTRLQVEHPVTEAVTGLDLVEWQLRVAAGEELPQRKYTLAPHGHAIEARLYAEDPRKGFLPSVGKLERLRLPEQRDGIRVDTGVREGDNVTVFYDPMIAKVIAWDETRTGAAARLADALAEVEIAGVQTNAGFLVRALRHPDFIAGEIDTAFIERHRQELLPGESGTPPEILARAALFLIEERRAKSRGPDPWDSQDGFRLSGEAREIIEFASNAKCVTVEILHHPGGAVTLHVGGAVVAQPAQAAAVRLSSGDIAVMQHGETWSLSVHDPLLAAEAAGAVTDRITAPMPGRIVQVLVRIGESVTQGQPVAILEAMKMEHTLKASADARVQSVEVMAGEQVGEGAVVVRFANTSSATA